MEGGLFVNPCSSEDPNRPDPSRTAAGNFAVGAPTLAYALAVAQPGDTIYLRQGLHYASNARLNCTATIRAYPGEQAWITSLPIARGWTLARTRVLSSGASYEVYRKSFGSVKVSSVLQTFTTGGAACSRPLAGWGWSSDPRRVTESNIAWYGQAEGYPAGEFYVYAAPGNGGAHVNPVAGDINTSVYLCLPAESDWEPDPNADANVLRAGDTSALLLYVGAQDQFTIDGTGPSSECPGLTFVNCGTGVRASREYGTGTIRNCRFESIGQQGILTSAADVRITGNSFENVGATGWDHGIYIAGDGGVVENNWFNMISGGAVHVYTADPRPRDITVRANRIGPGKPAAYLANTGRVGIHDWGDNTRVYNNLIHGFHVVGISLNYGAAECFNNTIVGATVAVEFGGPATGKNVVNNILVAGLDGTCPSDLAYVANAAPPNANNSLANNLYFSPGGCNPSFGDREPGPGAVQADPQFVNPGGHNYRLRATSPGIGAGDTSILLADMVDLDRAARIGGAGVDIGAYEYHAVCDFDGDGEVDMDDFGALQTCYTGNAEGVAQGSCAAMDVNRDGRVDDCDVRAFLKCRKGPGIPADSSCGATFDFAHGDGDGVPNGCDNCPLVPNEDQADADRDGIGDACEENPAPPPPVDGDSDGVADFEDNCPTLQNPGQEDADGDGVGDACDLCPNDPNKSEPGQCGCGQADADIDEDGVPDCIDDCTSVYNDDQSDIDGDGLGDVCDPDMDGDEIADSGYDHFCGDLANGGHEGETTNCNDNCPGYNPDQADCDGDGIGDVCWPEGCTGELTMMQTVQAGSDASVGAVSASLALHGDGGNTVTLPASGGTIMVDVIVENTQPITDFATSLGVNVAQVVRVVADGWTVSANVGQAPLPSWYDMSLFEKSSTGEGTWASPVGDLTMAAGWMNLRGEKCFMTMNPIEGVFEPPLPAGRHVVATLTLHVVGRVGSYRLTMPDVFAGTMVGEDWVLVPTTTQAFTIAVGGQ